MFNVGDRVIVANVDHSSLLSRNRKNKFIGHIGTIKYVDDNWDGEHKYSICMADSSLNSDGNGLSSGWYWYDSELKMANINKRI